MEVGLGNLPHPKLKLSIPRGSSFSDPRSQFVIPLQLCHRFEILVTRNVQRLSDRHQSCHVHSIRQPIGIESVIPHEVVRALGAGQRVLSAEYQAENIIWRCEMRNHPHVPFLGGGASSWKGELAIQESGVGEVFHEASHSILRGKGF